MTITYVKNRFEESIEDIWNDFASQNARRNCNLMTSRWKWSFFLYWYL